MYRNINVIKEEKIDEKKRQEFIIITRKEKGSQNLT
jgi:hypothetical protein